MHSKQIPFSDTKDVSNLVKMEEYESAHDNKVEVSIGFVMVNKRHTPLMGPSDLGIESD